MRRVLFFTYLLFCFTTSHAQIQTVGLFTHLPGSDDDGYVLFAPTSNSDTTYLMDKCGRRVHTWPSKYSPGADAYLLPDGTLLRSGHYPNVVFDPCNCGTGGIIERIDWNGNVVWSYVISDSFQVQSHDICYMPNGHILVDVWEKISGTTAIANGRKAAYVGSTLYLPKVMEIEPIGTNAANIIWTWRLFDHLVQDYSTTKPNYGIIKDHPELVNFNYVNLLAEPAMGPDWTHMNAVSYNPDLDQVMISGHNLNEIWIIDHSTTTAEAATHAGGAHNKGGDLLYRWGNPAVYNRGGTADTKLFQQHNPTWLTSGKYKNQIMVFNNGLYRPGSGGYWSSIDIINPPVTSSGDYTLATGAAYDPSAASWTYRGALPTDFYSMFMGGAQWLPNNNVLICNAMTGVFFEVDSIGNVLWKYINPVENGAPVSQGKTVTLNNVYRCVFYPSTYSGFTGHTLLAGDPIELYPLPSTCTVSIDSGLSAPSVTKQSTIQIYPNPANAVVSFKTNDLRSAALIDVTGKTIYNEQYNNSHSGEFNTATLPDGVYILCINRSEYKQIVVQH